MKLAQMLAAAILLALLPMAAKANLLDDFEKQFHDVSTNFNQAVEAGPDSRIASDFKGKLDDLNQLASRIQVVVTRLQIEDINLPFETRKIREDFQRRIDNAGKANGRSKSMEVQSGRWFANGQIKRELAELKEMGFTTDNGGSFQKKLAQKDGFDELCDLVDLYARGIKEVAKASENSEWRALFEKRLRRMQVLASQVQEKAMRDVQKTAESCNLTSEANFLDKQYRELTALYERTRSVKKANSNGGSASDPNRKTRVYDDNSGRTKNVTEEDRIMKDASYSLKKMQDALLELKKLGFTLEGRLTREAKEKGSGAATATPAEATADKDIAAMSAEELYGAIQKERDRIFNADSGMSETSPVVVRYYLKTLTQQQRQEYQDIVRRLQNRDYKAEVASGMAVRTMHLKLKTASPSNISPEDMAKLLSNIRKDKEQMDKDLEKERYSRLDK